jgi:hypothetical protein
VINTAKRIGRVALLLPLLSLAAGPSLQAAEKSDWDNLKQVALGQTIKVIATDGKSSPSDLQSVSDDALVLRLAGGDRSFPRDTVQRVSIKRNGHRGRHALIGAAIGAGAGLGAGIAIDNDCSPTSIVCTGNKGKAVLTPAFALLGAGIGALLPAGGWREFYRSR